MTGAPPLESDVPELPPPCSAAPEPKAETPAGVCFMLVHTHTHTHTLNVVGLTLTVILVLCFSSSCVYYLHLCALGLVVAFVHKFVSNCWSVCCSLGVRFSCRQKWSELLHVLGCRCFA